MQSLFDSLCQCLGSTPIMPRGDGEFDATVDESSRHHHRTRSDPEAGRVNGQFTVEELPMLENANSGSRSPATRRTSRLALKDKQWDALFDAVQAPRNNNNTLLTHRHGGTPDSSPDSGHRRNSLDPEAATTDNAPQLETAHVLAKAKQAANPSRYRMQTSQPPSTQQQPTSQQRDSPPSSVGGSAHKRKRPPASRDDIFRARKPGPPVRRSTCGTEDGEAMCMNPISKFLSNHSGFANVLCFATPIRDEEEEEEFSEQDRNNGDNASMADSEANTLNTCEDSMMMLDRKLALMSKNQPPMPLFHQFKVNQNEPEGLRKIVDTDSHSSVKLMQLWRQSHNARHDDHLHGSGGSPVPTTSSSSSSGGCHHPATAVRVSGDVLIPPMKKTSSSSSDTCPSTPSSNSTRSHSRVHRRGEI